MPKRVVLTTFGSYGDLHPYLAVAGELRRRGAEPVVATTENYQAKVEAAGFLFRPVRAAEMQEPTEALMQKVLHLRTGAEYIIRRLMMPSLRTAYEDTLAAAEGADLLVSHPLTFATPMVAEKMGLPWASSILAPMGFLSAYDPPVLPGAPAVEWMRALGPAFFRPVMRMGRVVTGKWTRPCDELRAELGLRAVRYPLFEGADSPALVLAMFSELLGAKQPDWPEAAVVTGFAFYDSDGEEGLTPELTRFLDAGEAPVVFTLGTSAVHDPGVFWRESVGAAERLGRRAVLLVGRDGMGRVGALPESVMAVEYAPFSKLFPRAAVVVHQGGVGTTGQAMRAGRPMLVMPYSVDQPDNAARVRRLGMARVIARTAYTAERAAGELGLLLGTASYAERAAAVGARVRLEDGAAVAAERLLAMLD